MKGSPVRNEGAYDPFSRTKLHALEVAGLLALFVLADTGRFLRTIAAIPENTE
jgi:hypothetical protein